MALSDDEQQRLDEIERALQRDGQEFAASVVTHDVTLLARAGELDDQRQRRLVAATTVMGLGLVVLLTGLVLAQNSLALGVIIGIAGLFTMTGAVTLFLRPGHHS
jgi:hypothetical protein